MKRPKMMQKLEHAPIKNFTSRKLLSILNVTQYLIANNAAHKFPKIFVYPLYLILIQTRISSLTKIVFVEPRYRMPEPNSVIMNQWSEIQRDCTCTGARYQSDVKKTIMLWCKIVHPGRSYSRKNLWFTFPACVS